eukprot:CAMPEP_0114600650 /NCGR_PEP_ID=MMETSP0125-20121206/23245_1 /TAXON_ID=485358 ORGANISM="Aristerostoma sp., Strain ATCC 50986" /NCGR_SAMPLE_ID=MMETSP0125 /ASSEMBLY_ACC=CAM_ASM_000245 /LENGTH=203 /DNA_ID=CAMNT_0001809043 /DNA_START=224 /DNA_END=833 /DNA_ORIENTATION=+
MPKNVEIIDYDPTQKPRQFSEEEASEREAIKNNSYPKIHSSSLVIWLRWKICEAILQFLDAYAAKVALFVFITEAYSYKMDKETVEEYEKWANTVFNTGMTTAAYFTTMLLYMQASAISGWDLLFVTLGAYGVQKVWEAGKQHYNDDKEFWETLKKEFGADYERIKKNIVTEDTKPIVDSLSRAADYAIRQGNEVYENMKNKI